MGASEWQYFAPYDPDILKVLHDLRQRVFERDGEGLRVAPYWTTMTFEEFLPPDPEFTEEDIAEYREEWERLPSVLVCLRQPPIRI